MLRQRWLLLKIVVCRTQIQLYLFFIIQMLFFFRRYVERRALTPLFDRNPLLGGKFYKLLALGLLRRVRALVNQTQFLKTLNFDKKNCIV